MYDEEPEEKSFIVLSDDEIARCLLALDNPQHRAIFQLMIDTGMSLVEILGDKSLDVRGVHIQDINSETLTLKVYSRFTKKDKLSLREIPISIDTVLSVRTFLTDNYRDLDGDGRMFDVKERRIRQFLLDLGEKAGIEKRITPIILRRTAIIRMLKKGLSPHEVRRRMGFIKTSEDIILSAAGYFVIEQDAYERAVKNAFINSFVPQPQSSSGYSAFSGGVV